MRVRPSDPERATPWNSKIASAIALGALLIMLLAQFHGLPRRDRIDKRARNERFWRVLLRGARSADARGPV